MKDYYVNEYKLNKRIGELKSMYKNKIFGKLISDPESDYYKVKEQNKYLQNKFTKLKNLAQDKLNEQHDEKLRLMKECNELKIEVSELKSEVRKINHELSDVKKENSKLVEGKFVNRLKGIIFGKPKNQ